MTTLTPPTRWEQVSGSYGTAALRHTHWLDATPRAYDGVAGLWWSDGGVVHGRDLVDQEAVDLAPFTDTHDGGLLLRAFARDDALALRVYDPENPARMDLLGIESYPHDQQWVISGRFVAAPEGTHEVTRSVDGHERVNDATGTVRLAVAGTPMQLSVSADDAGLFAVIADATAADGAYRFRFLSLPAPAADGSVTVDFNTAYLPPCAFSDQYVCPLPPPQNRFTVAITAGEKRSLRA